MNAEELVDMRKNYSKLNFKNYIISIFMILALYFTLFYTIKDEGIFSYKASIYINILIYILFALSLNVSSGILGELNLGHAGFISVGAYFSAVCSKIFIKIFFRF